METSPVDIGPLRILIVDDVQVNCRVLSGILGKYGICDIVNNGRDAVTSFQKAWKRNAPYHLMCLDIMLPDIEGLKVFEVLRKMETAMQVEASQRVHVIVITALDNAAHHAKAWELGCDGYLVKPIFRNALTDCLKKAGLLETPGHPKKDAPQEP